MTNSLSQVSPNKPGDENCEKKFQRICPKDPEGEENEVVRVGPQGRCRWRDWVSVEAEGEVGR